MDNTYQIWCCWYQPFCCCRIATLAVTTNHPQTYQAMTAVITNSISNKPHPQSLSSSINNIINHKHKNTSNHNHKNESNDNRVCDFYTHQGGMWSSSYHLSLHTYKGWVVGVFWLHCDVQCSATIFSPTYGRRDWRLVRELVVDSLRDWENVLVVVRQNGFSSMTIDWERD